MKLGLYFLILFFFTISCKQSKVYEIDRSNFKVLRLPVTQLESKVNKLDNESEIIKNKFKFNNTFSVPDYYAGLTPAYPMILGHNIFKPDHSCLRQSGGMIPTCYCLVIKVNKEYILIDSIEKAMHYFAPIQNKQEAISFLSLLTDSYPIYNFDFVKNSFDFKKKILNKTYVDSLSDGYIVHLFDYADFGCIHPYAEITYKIDYNGNYKKLNREEIFYDPRDKKKCVD